MADQDSKSDAAGTGIRPDLSDQGEIAADDAGVTAMAARLDGQAQPAPAKPKADPAESSPRPVEEGSTFEGPKGDPAEGKR
jgi:hypothetical protein